MSELSYLYEYEGEGALRQRFLDLDDRTQELSTALGRQRLRAAFGETFDMSWIFHENGLEGVVLSFAEIKSAVDNKIISDVSLLPTYNEIKNQKACIDLIRDKAQAKKFFITVAFLKDLHARLVSDEDEAGVYRKDTPIHRTYFHEIAQPAQIHIGLQKVLDFLKDAPRAYHAIELSAVVHHRFMRVFPFSRYSGILGRLVSNYVLLCHDYLPIVIHATDRQHYYEALRGSERDFIMFVLAAMESTLENANRFLVSEGSEGRRVS